MPACLRHSGPHACPHLHTVACPILCCQTRRSRVTCVFVKVRVCVSLAERDVKCDRNASEVAKHDCDKSGFFLGGGGKDEDSASSLPTFFPRLSSSFDSLGRNSTSRPADGSLSSPKPQLSSHLERLGCVYSQNSALYDFVLFYPWSDDHTTIWMSPHLPDYFSHQPLGFKPRLFLGLNLVFFSSFFFF